MLLLLGGGAAVYFLVLDQDLSKLGIGGNKTEQVDEEDDRGLIDEGDVSAFDEYDESDMSELGDEMDFDESGNVSLEDVLNEKAAELAKDNAKVVCKMVNGDNAFLLFVRDTHLYQFQAEGQRTDEVNLEKLNSKARVLFGGPQNGIRSWVYDDAAKTMTLKAQTYATDGKSAGIGEYKLNVETMALEVVTEGKVTQQQPQNNTEPEPELPNNGTGFHLERI